MDELFTISKLRAAAASALQSGNYEPAESARVRAIPDTRTIRYYTTIGLIDRPSEMRGRTAFYGRRHVEQLVVIKRMQSQGLTLSDIQRQLSGLSARKLSKLAALPKDWLKASEKEKKTASDSNTEANFWEKLPKAKRKRTLQLSLIHI